MTTRPSRSAVQMPRRKRKIFPHNASVTAFMFLHYVSYLSEWMAWRSFHTNASVAAFMFLHYVSYLSEWMAWGQACLLSQSTTGGWNSSVVCVGLAVLCDLASWVRSSPEPLVEGIFPLEVTWVLLDESINRGLLCALMHSIVRTQKILTFNHVLDRWIPATKTSVFLACHQC